jgi:hypothetical protein
MKCRYCQTDNHDNLDKYNACAQCHVRVIENAYFNKLYENGEVRGIWCVLPEYYAVRGLTVFFRYDLDETHITQYLKGVALKLPFVAPVTEKFLQDVPKKLKLWQVFS